MNNKSIKHIQLGLAMFAVGPIMILLAATSTDSPNTSDLTPSRPSSTLVTPDILSNVDTTLSAATSGSIAYNSPEKMQLNEIAIIELSLSPSLSEEELN